MLVQVAAIQQKEFLRRMTRTCRIRHRHKRRGARILEFTLQLEAQIGGTWHPVVRYDSAHGFAHRDLMRGSAIIEKTPIFGIDYKDALIFAESDLTTNWAVYLRRFLEEKKDDGR